MDGFNLLLDKIFWTPLSTIVLFAMMVIGVAHIVPSEGEKYTTFIIVCVAALIIYLCYVFLVVKKNSFPSCKNGKIGVLFVFRVVSNEQYRDIKYSVEQNFMDNVKKISNDIVPVCINSTSVKDYDINNGKVMTELLRKTNCYFCVEFFIETDCIDTPNKYLATINTGFIHPSVSEDLISYLKKAITKFIPVQKVDFTNDSKINTLKLTTTHLSILSEYIIGILFLVCDKASEAMGIFEKLNKIIDNTKGINILISEALHHSAIRETQKLYEEYLETGNKLLLSKAERCLNVADSAMPNQYFYHLYIANILFLKNRDISIAKEHIEKCKKINVEDSWRYSEAFLYTYDFGDPNVVYQKYRKLKNNRYNCLHIAEYIERILQSEPDKAIFHLALGIIYDNIDQKELASCNFRRYFENYSGTVMLRSNAEKTIKSRIDYSVCNYNNDEELCAKCNLKNRDSVSSTDEKLLQSVSST